MVEHLTPALEFLEPEEGSTLQILYLKKKNGTLRSFVGAALQPGEFDDIESIAQGEMVKIEYVDMDMEADFMDHDSRSCPYQ